MREKLSLRLNLLVRRQKIYRKLCHIRYETPTKNRIPPSFGSNQYYATDKTSFSYSSAVIPHRCDSYQAYIVPKALKSTNLSSKALAHTAVEMLSRS